MKSYCNPQTGLQSSFINALIKDFDDLFPTEIIEDQLSDINKLADKYCNQDITKCPICGSDTVIRTSKRDNKFRGCSIFPKCKGIRDYQTNRPSPNEALKIFLIESITKDRKKDEEKKKNRFANLL